MNKIGLFFLTTFIVQICGLNALSEYKEIDDLLYEMEEKTKDLKNQLDINNAERPRTEIAEMAFLLAKKSYSAITKIQQIDKEKIRDEYIEKFLIKFKIFLSTIGCSHFMPKEETEHLANIDELADTVLIIQTWAGNNYISNSNNLII